MTARIRDFTDDDVDWAVGFLHDWDPGLPTEAWRRIVTAEAAPIRRAIVAEVDGERIGLGGVNEPEGLPYPLISVVVDAGHRGRGIGSAMFAELFPLVAQADAGSGMPDHDEHSLAIARHWGFEVLGHGIDSVLDLDVASAGPCLPDGVEARDRGRCRRGGLGARRRRFLAQVGDFPEAEIYGSPTHQRRSSCRWHPTWSGCSSSTPTASSPARRSCRTGEGPWFIGFTGSCPAGSRARAGAGRQAGRAPVRLRFGRPRDPDDQRGAQRADAGAQRVDGLRQGQRRPATHPQGEQQVSGCDYFPSTGWVRRFRWSEGGRDGHPQVRPQRYAPAVHSDTRCRQQGVHRSSTGSMNDYRHSR